MILVTVGTERFPFDRLLETMEALRPHLNGEPVFMQTGVSGYRPSYPHERFIPFAEFSEKIETARIVVGHAGAGTWLMCAASGKLPIMMPRQRRLGEHVDNHQHMLARRMSEHGMILVAETAEEILDHILHYDERAEAALRKRKSAGQPLTDHLSTVLKGIGRNKRPRD